jgi:hypothetical protein
MPLLHCLYNPAGTSRDFTSTCAFPLVPTSEFKRRLFESTLTQAGQIAPSLRPVPPNRFVGLESG